MPATRPMKWAASTQKIAPTSSAISAEALEVDQPRDGRAAGEDHLGLVLAGQALDLVVVDVLGVLVDAVVHGVEPLAAERHLGAVGEVAAVRQAHREDCLAGLAGTRRRPPGWRWHRSAAARWRGRRRRGPWPARWRASRPCRPRRSRRSSGAPGSPRRTCCDSVEPKRGEHGRGGEVLARDELQAAAQAVQLGDQHARDLGVVGLRGRSKSGPVERLSSSSVLSR